MVQQLKHLYGSGFFIFKNRKEELNAMLDLNKKDNEIVDGDRDDDAETTETSRDNRDAR